MTRQKGVGQVFKTAMLSTKKEEEKKKIILVSKHSRTPLI
jgi:hypothetical protein